MASAAQPLRQNDPKALELHKLNKANFNHSQMLRIDLAKNQEITKFSRNLNLDFELFKPALTFSSWLENHVIKLKHPIDRLQLSSLQKIQCESSTSSQIRRVLNSLEDSFDFDSLLFEFVRASSSQRMSMPCPALSMTIGSTAIACWALNLELVILVITRRCLHLPLTGIAALQQLRMQESPRQHQRIMKDVRFRQIIIR